jgi:hypothetical protein
VNTWRHLTLSLLVLSLLTFSAATAAAQLVIINNVSINYTNNQLTINGSGFEPAKKAPTVNFNEANLTLVSFTNNAVVAQLPTTAAGAYQLIVTNSKGLFWLFDVTYGAVGPQGPMGLTGAQGQQGNQGPQGQQGNPGPAGPVGPAGAVGPIGPAGPAGPTGPAGGTGPAGPTGPAATIPPALTNLNTLFTEPWTGTGLGVYNYEGVTCTIGDIIFSVNSYGGGDALPADGRLLPISEYTAVFSIMGTNFGGDGITNFALPDLRNLAPPGLYYSLCVVGIFPSHF